jgi:hypothetical protein
MLLGISLRGEKSFFVPCACRKKFKMFLKQTSLVRWAANLNKNLLTWQFLPPEHICWINLTTQSTSWWFFINFNNGFWGVWGWHSFKFYVEIFLRSSGGKLMWSQKSFLWKNFLEIPLRRFNIFINENFSEQLRKKIFFRRFSALIWFMSIFRHFRRSISAIFKIICQFSE